MPSWNTYPLTWVSFSLDVGLNKCLFNLYTEYIMRNSGLEEAQAGIKIAERNISILRYADDITLMAESEEELKSLSMKVKEESEQAGLKFNIRKTKTMASSPITSWQIDGETMETVTDYFLGLQNHCRWWLQPWNSKTLAPWKKSYDNLAAAAAVKSLQSCLTLCDPIDGSPPGSTILGFFRQEHWSGLPFPSPVHENEK